MAGLLGILLFVTASTTLATILSDIFGSLTYGIAMGSLLVGLVCGGISFFKLRNYLPKLKVQGLLGYLMVALFIIFTFIHFHGLIYVKNGIAFVCDDSNFVDLPNHIMYINFFARGAHFWPENPFVANHYSNYPFGTDFFSSLFTKIGFSYFTNL